MKDSVGITALAAMFVLATAPVRADTTGMPDSAGGINVPPPPPGAMPLGPAALVPRSAGDGTATAAPSAPSRGNGDMDNSNELNRATVAGPSGGPMSDGASQNPDSTRATATPK